MLVDPLAGGVHHTEARLCRSVILLGGAAVQVHGLTGIPIDTEPLLIHRSELVLRLCVSQARSPPIPPGGFADVKVDTLTYLIQLPEIELGENVFLLGGAPYPTRRGHIVAYHTLAVGIDRADKVLRRRVALFGEGHQIPERTRKIAAPKLRKSLVHILGMHGEGEKKYKY